MYLLTETCRHIRSTINSPSKPLPTPSHLRHTTPTTPTPSKPHPLTLQTTTTLPTSHSQFRIRCLHIQDKSNASAQKRTRCAFSPCIRKLCTKLQYIQRSSYVPRQMKMLLVGWLCWGLTSQSTIFQSYRDGAIASWVINQYFRGVKCLAQGHNTAAVGLEPRTSRSGVRHSTTEPPRSPRWKCYDQEPIQSNSTSCPRETQNYALKNGTDMQRKMYKYFICFSSKFPGIPTKKNVNTLYIFCKQYRRKMYKLRKKYIYTFSQLCHLAILKKWNQMFSEQWQL